MHINAHIYYLYISPFKQFYHRTAYGEMTIRSVSGWRTSCHLLVGHVEILRFPPNLSRTDPTTSRSGLRPVRHRQETCREVNRTEVGEGSVLHVRAVVGY